MAVDKAEEEVDEEAGEEAVDVAEEEVVEEAKVGAE